ncbi:MAG TPA: Dyp-type peroxidase [Nocardioides sp.]|uniref:Dyp-type peroxidase n=1 Tax=uncultured Nocardioides sp. TaxID=198441 RepID=UPI000EC3AFEA|nr:Dyp-type peroxidase [uncultured Nocardioides sp.]HCB05174.1 peroxidase [Nocardioides sp.]HRD59962.1 Dyp-type peroxidase [Nocardioides sp.]HRI96514.1 Dyp-type peroxidase [Nocardioides sp.]HRK47172.1 Dyp-type peroxidase [Nocardioides sp.]
MALPQPGIFAVGTTAHGYVELDLTPDADVASVVTVLADLAERETTMGATNLVVGVRPELWADVRAGSLPEGLTGFTADLVGPDGFTIPATQHDAALWFAAGSYDVVFDAVLDALRRLRGLVTPASELRGWAYHRDRDLTGFEDGSENPTLASAPSYALVPDGSPGAGGSVLLLQQWVHDPAWLELTDAEQEAAIGRTKAGSIELDPRPESSHVARTDQDDTGHILRRNTAYGTATAHGTVFVGFASSRAPLHVMLERMAGIDGPRDGLTRFATPLTGAYYWVPASDDLVAFATPDED